ncbi:MAG: GatB/YqeY domain-containing protein [Ignavibacteria bacterium]|jgi:uncharacterized protein YqeY|nr:GatB/YqeY domain-containing protein [Ignavibacteria bacterium]MCU7501580.1 GatB/YqeY domain-containing protein [Ignavibacteria bacterium]MCU7517117.1 GatB/YqeY domain-containing protein [Ignavibacteria bacterium]
MSLKDKINEDLKSAMKSGDKLRLETIRSIRALILEFEKSGTGKTLNEEEELKMLSSAVKKRRDSVEQYRAAKRDDLADKEEAEMKIIMEYMPKQLTEEEVTGIVKKLATEAGASSKADFPKLMPLAMKELKGKADGKLVKSIVEKILG